jgi:hypothetical protein
MKGPSAIALLIGERMKAKAKPAEETEDDVNPLEACCEDLIAAVHAKDAKACAEAFRACVDVCESESGEE